MFALKYELKYPMPANGCVAVNFGAAVSLDSNCYPSYQASVTTLPQFSCSLLGQTYTLLLASSLTTGATLGLMFRAMFTTSLSLSSITTYYDSACTQYIEADSGTANPLVSVEATSAPSLAYLQAPEVAWRLAGPGMTAVLDFYYIPRTSLTVAANTYITLTFSSAWTMSGTYITLYCAITTSAGRLPNTCSLSSTEIRIYPANTLIAGTTYRIKVTTQGGPTAANGLTTPSANSVQSVALKSYQTGLSSDFGTLYFYLPSSLAVDSVSPMHKSPGLYNIFTIGLALSASLSATDTLVVEFPTMTEDGLYPLFAADLGTNLVPGSRMPCILTGITGSNCYLLQGSTALNVPAQIRITGGTASPGSISLELGGIYNPSPANSLADYTIVHLRVYIEDSSGVIQYDRAVYNLFSIDTTAYLSTDPTVAWQGSTPYNGSGGVEVRITFTTPGVGGAIIWDSTSSLILSTTTSTFSKFPTFGLLATSAVAGSPISIAGFTLGSSSITPVIHVILLNAQGVVLSTKSTTLATTLGSSVLTVNHYSELTAGCYSGVWQFVTVGFSAGSAVSATSYILIRLVGSALGTFDAFDGSFLSPGNLPSFPKWKTVTLENDKSLLLWSFASDLAASTEYKFRIYAKTSASIVYTVSIYTSSGLSTMSYSGVSPTQICTAPTSASSAVSFTLTPALNAGSPLTDVTVTYTSAQALDLSSEVTINLADTGLGCSGMVAPTATLNGSGALVVYSSSKVTVSDASAAGSTSLSIALSWAGPPDCQPTAGYMHILVCNTVGGATAQCGTEKFFVSPASSLGSFTLKSMNLSPDFYTILHGSMGTGLALNSADVVQFGFPVDASTPDFLPDLGLGYSSGNSVPFWTSTGVFSACWLQAAYMTQGFYTTFPTSVYCTLASPLGVASPAWETEFINVLTVRSATVTYVATTHHFGSTWVAQDYAQAVNGNGGAVSGASCSQLAQGSVSATSSSAGASASYTFQWTTASMTYLPGYVGYDVPYMVLIFGSDFDLSSVTGGANTQPLRLISSPAPCPCLIVPFTWVGPTTSPSFVLDSIINPSTPNFYNIFAYDIFPMSCRSAYRFSMGVDSVGLEEVQVSVAETGTSLNSLAGQWAFARVSMTLPGSVNPPSDGSLRMQIAGHAGGTFLDFDSTYVSNTNFPTPFRWTVSTSATGAKTLVLSNLSGLAIGTTYALSIWAKYGPVSVVTASLLSGSGNVWGGTSTVLTGVVEQTYAPTFASLRAAFSPALTVGTASNSVTLVFQVGVALANTDNIIVGFSHPVLSGSLSSPASVTVNSSAAGSFSLSGASVHLTPDQSYSQGASLTVIVVWTSGGLTAASCGFFQVTVLIQSSGGIKKQVGACKGYAQHNVSPTTFSIQSLTTTLDSTSVLKVTFKSGTGSISAGAVLSFGFPTSAGFLYDLGLSIAQNQVVPFWASEAAITACWLLPTRTDAVFADFAVEIHCSLGYTLHAVNLLTIYFPHIQTPKRTVTAEYQFTVIPPYTGSNLTPSEGLVSTQTFTNAACSSASSGVIPNSLTTSTSTSYRFPLTFVSGTPTAGDVLLLMFDSNIDTSNASAGSGVGAIRRIASPSPCPCVIVELSAAGPFTISSLTNPGSVGIYSIQVYPYLLSAGNTCAEKTNAKLYMSSPAVASSYPGLIDCSSGSYSPASTVGLLSSLAVSKVNPAGDVTLGANQDSFWAVSFSSAHTIPACARLQVTFPASDFETVQFFAVRVTTGQSTGSFSVASNVLEMYINEEIAAGTTFTLSGVYAPIRSTSTGAVITVQTWQRAGTIDQSTATLAFDTTWQYLRRTSLYAVKSYLAGQVASQLNGAATRATLKLCFQTPAAGMSGTDTIQIDTPANAFVQQGTLYSYFETSTGNRMFARSATQSGGPSTVVGMPANTALSASTEYNLVVGSWDSAGNGLVYSDTSSDAVTVTLSYGGTTEIANNLRVPGALVFEEMYVKAFTNTALRSGLIRALFSTLQSISSTAEILLEFPVVDSTYFTAMFPVSAIDSVSCALYVDNVISTSVQCTLHPGDFSNTAAALRRPNTVLLSSFGSINPGSTVLILLSSVANPVLAGVTADVSLSVRTSDSGKPECFTLSLYQTFEGVVVTSALDFAGTTGKWPSFAGQVAVGSTADYLFEVTHSGAAAIVLVFPAIYPISGSHITTTDLGNSIYAIWAARTVVILPSSSLAAATSTFSLQSVPTPNYIPAVLSTSEITAYVSTNSLAVTQISLSNNQNAFAWSSNTVTFVSEVGLYTQYYKGTSDRLTIAFSIPVNLVSGAVVDLSFPTDLTLKGYVSASSTATFACTAESGPLWRCSLSGSYTSNALITVYGWVTFSSTGNSETVSADVYYDASRTLRISQIAALTTFSLNDSSHLSVPDEIYIPVPRNFNPIPVKAGQNGPISVIFTPTSGLTVGSDTIAVKENTGTYFTYTPGTGSRVICLFIPQSTYIEYAASSCTYSAGTWTATVPSSPSIDSSQKWNLRITVNGKETNAQSNGIAFPSSAANTYRLKVTFFSTGSEFIETLPNIVAKITGVTVTPMSYEAQRQNFYVVNFKDNATTNLYVSLVFPTTVKGSNAYPSYLGNAVSTVPPCGADFISTTTAYTCAIAPGLYHYMSSRLMRIDLKIDANPNNKSIYYGGITNPSTGSLTVWTAVQVWDSSTKQISSFALLNDFFTVTTAYNLAAALTTPLDSISTSALSASGVSATLQLDISVDTGYYIIATMTTTVSGSSNMDGRLITLPSSKVMISQCGSPAVDPVHFSGLINPTYVTSTAIISVVVYGQYQAVYMGYYYDSSPDGAKSIAFTASSTPTSFSNGMYNSFEFKTTSTVVSGVYKLTFDPSSFQVKQCFVPIWSTTVLSTNQGSVACNVYSNYVTVDILSLTYTLNSNLLDVKLWVVPDSMGNIDVKVELYADTALANMQGTQTVTLLKNAELNVHVTSAIPYVYTDPYTVLRASNTGPLTFSFAFNTGASLIESLSYVAITLPTGTFSALTSPTAMQCLWSSGSVQYLSPSCSYTTGAQITITSKYPSMASSLNSFSLVVTSTNTVNPGLTVTSTSGDYAATISLSVNGMITSSYAETTLFIAPALATSASAQMYGTTYNSTGTQGTNYPTALQLTFAPTSSVVAGLENSGSSEIVISFDSSQMGTNLGLNSLVTANVNLMETDCAWTGMVVGVGTGTAKCYVRQGATGQNSENTEVWVRNTRAYSQGGIIVAPMYHRANTETLITVKAVVRRWSGSSWTYVHYMEFRYLARITSTSIATRATGSLGQGTLQAQFNVAFDIQQVNPPLATQPSLSNNGLVILLNAEQQSNFASWGGMVNPTAYALTKNYAVLFKCKDNSPLALTLQQFPMPDYGANQTWLYYVFTNYSLSGLVTFTFQMMNTAPVSGVDIFYPASVIYDQQPIDVVFTIPLEALTNKGSEIRIVLPANFRRSAPAIQPSSYCALQGDVPGPYTCTYETSKNAYRLLGYTGTDMSLQQVSIRAIVSYPVATSQIEPVTVKIYGKANDDATIIYNYNKDLTMTVYSSYTKLEISTPTWYQPKRQTIAAQQANLSFLLKPRTTPYDYKYSIVIQTFSLTFTATAQLVCTLALNTSPANYVLSEGGCSRSGDVITVVVPEQLTLQMGTTYRIDISATDFNGVQMPTMADLMGGVLPGKTLWYLQVKNPNGTVVEASKITKEIYGTAFSTLTPKFGIMNTNYKTYFDLLFQLRSPVPDGGLLVVEFPTHNEIQNVYSIDLGLQTSAPTPIPCSVNAGFVSTVTPLCTVYPVSSAGSLSPVLLKVSGLGDMDISTVYRILIGWTIKTPAVYLDPVFNVPIQSGLKVYTLSSAFTGAFSLNYASYSKMPTSFTKAYTTPTYPIAATATTSPNNAGVPATFTLTLGYNSVVPKLAVGSGRIIFIFDSNIYVENAPLTSSGSGNYYKIVGANLVVVEVESGQSDLPLTKSAAVTVRISNPAFSVDSGYVITAYIVDSNGQLREILNVTLDNVLPAVSTLTVDGGSSGSIQNTYNVYTFTLTQAAQGKKLQRVILQFPWGATANSPAFQWLDAACQVIQGLEEIAITNRISCVSDCGPGQPCTGLVTITNFKVPNPTVSSIKVSIGAMSPASAGLCDAFTATLYHSTTGTTQVIEGGSFLMTVSAVTRPFDVWMEWPERNVYDRLITAGGTGELLIRFTPNKAVKPQTGTITVKFPSELSISTNGVPTCQLAYGDLYDDNYPLQSRRTTSRTPVPCSWDYYSNTMDLALPAAVDRVWTGIGAMCTWLLLTTTGANGGLEGFTVPSYPDSYYAVISTYEQSTLLESINAEMVVSGPSIDPTLFSMQQTLTTQSVNADFFLFFTTNTPIPEGFRTFTGLAPNDVGSIVLSLGTYHGFDSRLGNSYFEGDRIPCAALQGLTGTLECHVSPSWESLEPAYVWIGGFDFVAAGTEIGIALSNIGTPPLIWTTSPVISLSILRQSSIDSTYYLASPASPNPTVAPSTPSTSAAVTAFAPGNDPSYAAPTIGEYGLLRLPLLLTVPLNGLNRDLVDIVLPLGSFQRNFNEEVTIKVVNFSSGVTIGSLKVQQFPNSEHFAALLDVYSLASGVDYYLEIAGYASPAALSCYSNCAIIYYSIASRRLGNTFATSADLVTLFGLQPGQVTNFQFSSTSLVSSAVNQRFTLSFTLVPAVPFSSLISVQLPSGYPGLAASDPVPVCTPKTTAVKCVLSNSGLILTAQSDLQPGSAIQISILGAKNPLISGSFSGFSVSAKTSTDLVIIAHTQTLTLTLSAAGSVPQLGCTLVPDLYSALVSANYTLTCSTPVPFLPDSILNVGFSSEFKVNSDFTCRLYSGFSMYRYCTASGSTLSIRTSESLAQSTSFQVGFTGILNPPISTSQAFSATVSVSFDGVVQAQTGLKLTITAGPAQLVVSAVTAEPRNLGQPATYVLTCSSPVTLPAGGSLLVLFPSGYMAKLVAQSTAFACFSLPPAQSCSITATRQVQFASLSASISPSQSFTLTLTSILSPSDSVNSNSIGVRALDSAGTAVLAEGRFKGLIARSSGPAELLVERLWTDEGTTSEVTNYNFRVTLGVNRLEMEGVLLVYWPSDYLLTLQGYNYTCQLTYNAHLSTNCSFDATALVTQIGMPVPVPETLNSSISLTISGVMNPVVTSTGVFTLKYLDDQAKLIKSMTFGTRNARNSFTFTLPKYYIELSTSQISVFPGTFSDPVEVRLTGPSLQPVTLELSSASACLVIAPEIVTFEYSWEVNATFVVGAKADCQTGVGLVRVRKYEESAFKLYRTVPSLKVAISAPGESDLKVTVDPLPALIPGAPLWPVSVRLSKPCMLPISVEIATSGAALLKNSLFSFPAGSNTLQFWIGADAGSTSGTLSVTVRTNAKYTAQTSQLQYTVLSMETPQLLAGWVRNVTRTGAEVVLQFSAPTVVYHMHAFKGTRAPSVSELQQGYSRSQAVSQVFGRTHSAFTAQRNSSLAFYTAFINLTGLIDQSEYYIAYSHDLYYEKYSSVSFLSLTTLPSYPITYFVIYTSQPSTPEAIRYALSQASALPLSYIRYVAQTANATTRRLTDYIPYQFRLVLDRSTEIGSPRTILERIDTRQDVLRYYLPTFSQGLQVVASQTAVNPANPQFIYSPKVAEMTDYTVTIDAIQNTDGRLYGIVTKATDPRPSSQQIIRGLDSSSTPLPRTHFQSCPCLAQKAASLRFTDLLWFHKYTVWLAGVSDEATLLGMMADEDVKGFNVTAGKGAAETQATFYVDLEDWGQAMLLSALLVLIH